MTSKRDHSELSPSETDGATVSRPSKKARNQPATIDQTYGQRYVFGDLDDYSASIEDGLEFEDTSEALAYLRSVRTESNGIPTLLVAPKAGPQLPSDDLDRCIYTNGVGDTRAYYQDGAYVAGPDTEYGEDQDSYEGNKGQSTNRIDATERTPAEAFYQALIARFTELRDQLHTQPPAEVVEALPLGHETTVGRFGAKTYTFSKWTKRLRDTDPLAAQVAAMDRHSALKLLRILLSSKFLRRGCELRERTSRWIWALLARLPDSGEMDYEEVGWIRELGKRAVLMMVSLAQMAALQEEVDGDLEGEYLEELDSDTGGDQDERPPEKHQVNDRSDGEGPMEDSKNPEATVGDTVEGPQGKSDAFDSIEVPVNHDEGGRVTSVDQAVHPEEGDGGEMDMDIDSDEEEEGEVSEEPTDKGKADLAAAKERLMRRLQYSDYGADTDEDVNISRKGKEPAMADLREEEPPELEEFNELRSRMNARATLNMILTVAGEFYGQRDLLEFRDPFAGM